MEKNVKNIIIIISVVAIIFLSVYGPRVASSYTEKNILEKVQKTEESLYIESFKYSLTSNEKLYILKEALKSRSYPQSEYFKTIKGTATTTESFAPRANMSQYAYVPVYKEPGGSVISARQAVEACNQAFNYFYEGGAMPLFKLEDGEDSIYDVTLFSAVDIYEPEKNMTIWQITFNKNQPLSKLKSVLIEAYVDAASGKIYLFSVRTDEEPENFEPELLIKLWADYLELGQYEQAPKEENLEKLLDNENLIHQNYIFNGIADEKVNIKSGLYKSINEIFIQIGD